MNNILILQYGGIGDAIVNAPLVASIIQTDTAAQIFLSGNAMWRYLKENIYQNAALQLLPDCYRSLSYIPDLEEFIVTNSIREIISFRRDSCFIPQYRDAYESIFRKLSVTYIGYEDYFSEDIINRTHFYDISRNLICEVGPYRPPPNLQSYLCPLLRNKCSRTYPKEILIYLGASQYTKRLPVQFWTQIIRHVVDDKHSVVIARSRTNEERLYEESIFRELGDYRHFCSFICPDTFDDMLKYIYQNCRRIISCDTYMVHLAVALDIPVYAIYISTDSTIYGPKGKRHSIYQNPGYAMCDNKNNRGNCSLWGTCMNMPCMDHVDIGTLVNGIDQWIKQGATYEKKLYLS